VIIVTTRHAGYVVTPADDIRDDDAEHIINALKMIKGVVSVLPVEADLSTHIATERVHHQVEFELSRFARHLFNERYQQS
jgi:hypothetical protein